MCYKVNSLQNVVGTYEYILFQKLQTDFSSTKKQSKVSLATRYHLHKRERLSICLI